MADTGTGIDIEDIIAAASSAKDAIVGSIGDMIGSIGIGQSAAKSKKEAAYKSADAQNTVDLADMTAKRQEQAHDAQAATALHINPNTVSDVLSSLSADAASRVPDILARQKDIDERTAVGFFDNPIQNIINGIVLPFKEEALASRKTGLATDIASIKGFEEAAQSTFATNAAIDASTSTEKLAGLQKLNLAKAQKEAADADYELSRLGIEGASARMAGGKGIFELTMQVNTAKNEVATMQLRQAQEKREEDREPLYEAYKQQMIDLKADKIAQDKLTQDGLDRFTSTYGMPKMPVEQFKMLDPGTKQSIEQGMMSNDVQEGRMGVTPARALANLNRLPNAGTPGMNITRQHLLKVVQDLSNDLLYNQQTKPDVKLNMEDKAIEANVNRWRNNIPDTDNMYSPGSLANTLALPAVKDFAITKALMPAALANKLHPTRANDIMNTAAALIAKAPDVASRGSIIKQMSEEISTMYRAVGADINTRGQFSRYALPGIDDKSGYKTSIDNATGWGSSKINMMDKAAVENALIKRMLQSQDTTTTGVSSEMIMGN